MVVQCPLLNKGQLTTAIILPKAELLHYNNTLYTMKLVDEHFLIFDRLKAYLDAGYRPIITWNIYEYQVYRGKEVVQEKWCVLELIGPRHFKAFEFPYEYMLHRIKGVILHYDNAKSKVLRVQRFLRQALHKKRSERALAFVMSAHSRLGQFSNAACLPADLLKKVLSFP